jgi:hypothetical protein
VVPEATKGFPVHRSLSAVIAAAVVEFIEASKGEGLEEMRFF